MNQPAFQEGNTWEGDAEISAQAKILQTWRESKEGPGKYLQQLRELKGKKPQEMATELGLSLTQFNALENDDKEELPAPIYVKSYIKRYCQCLGILESEYETILDEMSKTVQPTLSRVSIRQNANTRQILVNWIGYAAVIGLLGLLFLGAQAIDFSSFWNKVASNSSVVEESTATELSLPVIVEEPVLTPKKNEN